LRQLKFTIISNKKKSEDKLINRIRGKYGNNITIFYGDWGASNKGNKMRNLVSTPNIGLIRQLERCAKIYLVDEYKTSKLCHCCKSETDYYKSRTYMKNGIEKEIVVHGLLRCKNELCSKLWNRDVNGSSNILEKGKFYLTNKEYPKPFNRIVQST
jgi:transposase